MKRCTRFVTIILIISLILSVPVYATEEATPWSSSFIFSYDPYIYYESGSYFEIWFDVVAHQPMDEVGVSEIEVKVSSDGFNWTTAATYYPEDYPQMILENTGFNYDYVPYTGAIGYYYKAYVTFYAKNSTGIGEISAYTQTIRLIPPT